MPVPALNVVEGEDIVAVLDSLEKQRKELLFILENLDTTNVNGFDASVINAGVINGEHLFIDSSVSFAAGYDPEGLRTEMRTQFTVTDGLIAGKVSIEKFDALGVMVANNASTVTQTAIQIRAEVTASVTSLDGKITAANSSITQTASSIRSEVATSVSSLDGKITAANSSISQLSGQISLKASQSEVNSLGTRVGTAEISIGGLNNAITSKVSSTDYNGVTLVSMINQTSSSVTIDAKNINLLGITNVADTLYIGRNVRDSTLKSIWFRGNTGGVSISSPSVDNLRLGAIGEIQLDGDSINMSTARSINWGNNKPVAIWG